MAMTIMYQFTIHGKAVGYYSQGRHPNWKRMVAYREWKKDVQACAMAIGITLPLTATEVAPLMIRTVAYFENRVHPDPENVRKGVSDALFYGAKGGDKYCGGSFPPPKYDVDDPRVEVTIERVDAHGPSVM